MSDAPENFGYPIVDLPPSAVSGPDAAVRFLVAQLVQAGRLRPEDADRAASQVLRREALGSTGIGRGVALPHSKSDVVSEVLGIVGRSAAPVTWPGAADAEPVHLVCLLIAPALHPETSLRALEALVRQVRGN